MRTEPAKKIDRLRELMRTQQWAEAFALAARFPRLGAERGAILDAHEAFVRPDFLRQLRKDPSALIERGIAAMRCKYAC